MPRERALQCLSLHVRWFARVGTLKVAPKVPEIRFECKATAIVDRCGVIVTHNLKHFLEEALARYNTTLMFSSPTFYGATLCDARSRAPTPTVILDKSNRHEGRVSLIGFRRVKAFLRSGGKQELFATVWPES
jgi:hypothetical protein